MLGSSFFAQKALFLGLFLCVFSIKEGFSGFKDRCPSPLLPVKGCTGITPYTPGVSFPLASSSMSPLQRRALGRSLDPRSPRSPRSPISPRAPLSPQLLAPARSRLEITIKERLNSLSDKNENIYFIFINSILKDIQDWREFLNESAVGLLCECSLLVLDDDKAFQVSDCVVDYIKKSEEVNHYLDLENLDDRHPSSPIFT